MKEITRVRQNLEKLLKISNPSRKEGKIRELIVEHLKKYKFNVEVDKAGNVLAVRGSKDRYVMLNAHMDSVYEKRGCYSSYYYDDDEDEDESVTGSYLVKSYLYDYIEQETGKKIFDYKGQPSTLVYNTDKEVKTPIIKPLDKEEYKALLNDAYKYLFGDYKKKDDDSDNNERQYECFDDKYDGISFKSTDGEPIGGDDKCGLAIIMTIAQTTNIPLKICLSIAEEIGCVGIDEVSPQFFDDVDYSLTLDRRGDTDLIYQVSRRKLYSDVDFLLTIIRAGIEVGVMPTLSEGMLADVMIISEYVENCCNMSVGYYSPHTDKEVIVLDDLYNSYNWVKESIRLLYKDVK
jgi:di/tripeptidase